MRALWVALGVVGVTGGAIAVTATAGEEAAPEGALRDSRPVVSVEPPLGTPTTAFRVVARAIHPLGEGDTYYLASLEGPGGEDCRGRTRRDFTFGPRGPAVAEEVSFVAPPGRWRTTGGGAEDDIQGAGGTWCPGTYRGEIIFHDEVGTSQARRAVTRPVGRFSFRVASPSR